MQCFSSFKKVTQHLFQGTFNKNFSDPSISLTTYKGLLSKAIFNKTYKEVHNSFTSTDISNFDIVSGVIRLIEAYATNYNITVSLSPFMWTWPQNCLSAQQIRGLWELHLTKYTAIYDTNLFSYMTPTMFPKGDGKWIIDLSTPFRSQHFDVILGPDKYEIAIGRTKAELIKLSDNGDIQALIQLGHYHYFHNELKNTFEIFQRASNLNSPQGHCFLGMAYFYGQGCEQNLILSQYYYEKAAQLNDPQALHVLGVNHDITGAFEENYEKALSYHLKAVEAGNQPSTGCVAAMYLHGRGTPKNEEKAIFYAKKGYLLGEAYCAELLADIHYDHTNCYDKRYFDLMRFGSYRGSEKSFKNLGTCYLNGFGCKADIGKALEWLEKCVLTEEEQLQLAITVIKKSCSSNSTLPLDKAIALLQHLVEKNNIAAIYQLGQLYYLGDYLEEDADKAIEYFFQAAESGYPEAMNNLSILLYREASTLEEALIAFHWCCEAASLNELNALKNLPKIQEGIWENFHMIVEPMYS